MRQPLAAALDFRFRIDQEDDPKIGEGEALLNPINLNFIANDFGLDLRPEFFVAVPLFAVATDSQLCGLMHQPIMAIL